MLSALTFEIARPQQAAAPERTDIACFIGYVARRPGAQLTADERSGLRAAGWLDGPWQRDPAKLEELEQTPVVMESWGRFAQLFAWERRPLRDGGDAVCASYLGAAVRSFFAHGGRRAVVIRVADPFPMLEADGARAANRDERLARLVPMVAAGAHFDATDPRTWRGTEHLYGLPEVSHLCLPDLADICAADPLPLPTAFSPPPGPEGFVECSANEPALPEDDPLARVTAPCSDTPGFAAFGKAVSGVRSFLFSHRRDTLFVGALPAPMVDARHTSDGDWVHAQTDLLSYMREVGILEAQDAHEATGAASAFVQLGWPWLRTRASRDLPGGLEPPDGLLAGLLAANALSRGTFRSIGGTPVRDAAELQPEPPMGIGPDSPTTQLAERLCVFGREPEGIVLLSDVTTSPDPAWRFGGASRIVAAVLRAARRFGEEHLFEPNRPQLWAELRRVLEAMLFAFWREGGLGGATPADAYSVICDRTTMTQNDLDAGRLKAEIRLLPAAAITHITVMLDLTAVASGPQTREVA